MKFREEILRLRAEGKKYREIMEILGCSEGTISYNLSESNRKMHLASCRKWRSAKHPYDLKRRMFFTRKKQGPPKISRQTKLSKILYIKLQTFMRYEISMKDCDITVEDIINKLGENPRCYLTGDLIDIYKPATYQFDHIIPASRGGENTLENLGICTKNANLAKSNMTVAEFKELCHKVIEYDKITSQ